MRTVQQILDYKGHDVWHIDPDAMVLDAIGEMKTRDVGALAVTEGAKLVGLISERDYARGVALEGRSSRDTRVRDVMQTELPTVTPTTDVETCMALMTRYRTRHLPVLQGDEMVGLLSIGDLVAAIIADQQSTIEHLEQYIATG
jgi:CBS domain-containing protein